MQQVRSKYLIAAFVLFLGALIAAGCSRAGKETQTEKQKGNIVRVGEIVLSDEDLEHLLPEGERVPFTLEEKAQYIQRWV